MDPLKKNFIVLMALPQMRGVDLDKPFEHYEHPKIVSKILQVHPYMAIYHPHCRVTVLARVPQDCIIFNTQFSI